MNVRCETTAEAQIISCKGELDLATRPKLKELLAAIPLDGHKSVTINLRPVTYLDASCFGVLVEFARRAKQEGKEIKVIASTQGMIKRILEILKDLQNSFAVEYD